MDLQPDPVRHSLLLRPRWRHRFRETADGSSKLSVPISFEDICEAAPPIEDCSASLKQHLLAGVRFESTRRELPGDSSGTRSHVRRLPARYRPMNAVSLCCPRRSSNGPLRSVRFHAEVSQMLGEVLPPLAQHRLADVESRPLLAHRPDYHVHMRMALVNMERHSVSVLQRKPFPREDLHCA